MLPEYFEDRKRRIETDLASFADQNSVIVTSAGERRLHAEWQMRGESCEATFKLSPDHGVTVNADGGTQPYASFLATTRMANLRQVAQMIELAGRRQMFVQTRAHRSDQASNTELSGSAVEVLIKLLENDEADTTEVIMVTGEAGSGKTSVLRELVRVQASRYLVGQTRKLFLYINAQGRALARLNEALATELQDLKVDFTYHSVPTLTRVGLLVPIIDGFDELLGVSGYDDAFNSLSTFLEQLEGQGRLLASARSVYYEEEFLDRAGRSSASGVQAWSHIPVKIEPWEQADRNHFLTERFKCEKLVPEQKSRLQSRVTAVFRDHQELATKPLFFAKTVDLLLNDMEFSGGEDLLDSLTHGFLEREQKEKLLGRQQQPLLSKDRLDLLMGELAEEMWNQETRELDRSSIREVAEYVLDEEDVPESSRQIVVERMPTLAFLARGERAASIQFEHEIFFFYFLARAIAKQFVQNLELRIMLGRSALPEFVAERVAFELRKRDQTSSLDDLQKILDRLSEAGRTNWRRTRQVQENAGLIVLALLRKFASESKMGTEIAECTISSVIFPGSTLAGVTLRKCTLSNISILRTDLATTKFIECKVHNVRLEAPRVNTDSTRLELDGLRVPEDVSGIQPLSDQGNTVTYVPSEIENILRKCGTLVMSNQEDSKRKVPDDLLRLLNLLMRAYRKANPICKRDDNLKKLFGGNRWPELQTLLTEHGIVKLEHRRTSGSQTEFLRRQFSIDDISSGQHRVSSVDPQIIRFWDALEKVDP